MTDDIVERLREFAPITVEDRRIAADEIERLRAELAAERERRGVDFEVAYWKQRHAHASISASSLEAERDALRAELAAERNVSKRLAHLEETLSGQLAASHAERDAMRELLRPFAKAADNFDSFPIKDAEGWFAYSGQSSFNKVTGAITVGDLRRARAALGGQGDA